MCFLVGFGDFQAAGGGEGVDERDGEEEEDFE